MLQLLLSIYRRDAMARNAFFLINLTNQKLIFCLQCSDSDIIQHIFSEQHHFLFLYFCSLTAVRLQRFTYSSRPFPVSHCHADWTFYSHSEMMSSVSYTPTHTKKILYIQSRLVQIQKCFSWASNETSCFCPIEKKSTK